MAATVSLSSGAWLDLGPTPLVLDLNGRQTANCIAAAAAPPVETLDGILLEGGRSLLFDGVGRRVYARSALPAVFGEARVTVRTIAEYLDAPPPIDIRSAAARVALLSGGGALAIGRPPLAFLLVGGGPIALTSVWQKVATTTLRTKGLRIAPLASATVFDIEWVSVAAGAAAPTDAVGEPVGGGEDFPGGLPLGDVYLKSLSGQSALVKLGA